MTDSKAIDERMNLKECFVFLKRLSMAREERMNLKECFVILKRLSADTTNKENLKFEPVPQVKVNHELTNDIESMSSRKGKESNSEFKKEIKTEGEFFGNYEVPEFQTSISEVKVNHELTNESMPFWNGKWSNSEFKKEIKTEGEFLGIDEELREVEVISGSVPPWKGKGSNSEFKKEIKTEGEFFGIDEETSQVKVNHEVTNESQSMPTWKGKGSNSEFQKEIKTEGEFFGIDEETSEVEVNHESVPSWKGKGLNSELKNEIKTEGEFFGNDEDTREVTQFEIEHVALEEEANNFKRRNGDSTLGEGSKLPCEIQSWPIADNISTNTGKISDVLISESGNKLFFRHSRPSHRDHNSRNINYKAFRCNECGVRYSSKHILKIHMENKTIKCEYCELSFTCTTLLKIHISALHLIFECLLCESATSHKSLLNIHINKAHSKPEDYICPNCQYSCRFKEVFAAHYKTHFKSVHKKIKGSDSQNCEKTNLNFYSRSNLGKLKCSRCKYACSQKENLFAHIKLVHEDPFKTYPARGALFSH